MPVVVTIRNSPCNDIKYFVRPPIRYRVLPYNCTNQLQYKQGEIVCNKNEQKERLMVAHQPLLITGFRFSSSAYFFRSSASCCTAGIYTGLSLFSLSKHSKQAIDLTLVRPVLHRGHGWSGGPYKRSRAARSITTVPFPPSPSECPPVGPVQLEES